MANLNKQISLGFENWADLAFSHHKLVILLCAMLMAGFISQIPKLMVDTTVEGFLYKDDPAMVAYDQFRDQFGRDDRIVIGIQGVEVFAETFLRRLASFHQAIEARVPYLEEVQSLINARNVHGTEDELVVEDLFAQWPETAAQLAAIKKLASDNPLYRNLILSADGSFTTVVVKVRRYGETLTDDEALDQFDLEESADQLASETSRLLSEAQNDEVIAALFELIQEHDQDSFQIHAAGQPVLSYTLKNALIDDMRIFVALAVGAIAILLLLLFRSFWAIIPPLAVVVCSLLSTLSCMAMSGVPVQIPTQILPSFLLAVGVADSVHIMTIFHYSLRTGEEKPVALRQAMGHAALPIVFTSLTTAGALSSFIGSEIAPVSMLGVFAPVGVFFALFYSVVLLPALIALLPARSSATQDQFRLSGQILNYFGLLALRNPWRILLGTSLLAVLSFSLATRLHFSHNPLLWLPEDAPLRQATLSIDTAMSGTMSMEILLDKKEQGAFLNPENLTKLAKIAADVEGITDLKVAAGQSISLVDVLKEIHKALNENRQDYYQLADSQQLISQELLLFENSGSEDLQELVDTIYSKTRLTLLVNWSDALEYVPFVKRVERIAHRYFSPEEVTITGLIPILSSTISAMMRSVVNSYLMAMIIIVPLMMLMVNSIKVGALAMAPNIVPILLCLGVMGALDIPIDGFTMLIGSVAIGLVVDDTIHFIHHFKRYLDESGSVEIAVTTTLQTTGRAMLFTTIVLVCGFTAFTVSSMQNLVNFGALTALAITLALLADILMMPALVSIVYRQVAQGTDPIKETEQ